MVARLGSPSAMAVREPSAARYLAKGSRLANVVVTGVLRELGTRTTANRIGASLEARYNGMRTWPGSKP
jgi:hypothetical protein